MTGLAPILAQNDTVPIHPIGWALIIMAGLVVLGIATLILRSMWQNRRPNPRNPAQMMRHHVKLLMYHVNDDPRFPRAVAQFAKLFRELVPDAGRSATVQGELIRSVDRLASEERRNGNMNWGAKYASFTAFLRERLLDESVFSEEEITTLASKIELIHRNGTDAQNPKEVRVAFGDLIVAAVAYCQKRPVPIQLPTDPASAN